MSRFDERRAEAIERTTDPLARELLDRMPLMVSHPAPSGAEEMCYQDGALGGAIACSQSEVRLLNLVGKYVQKGRCLEIGSYVGWSTAALALKNERMTLYCVDSFTEEAGYLHITPNKAVMGRFFDTMRALGLEHRVRMHIGTSPECLSAVTQAAGGPWDFVFLDGWHLDGQPERDVDGLLPFLAPRALLVLHDVWMTDVKYAARKLVANGWTLRSFPTPNTLSFLWRKQPSWWRTFVKEANTP